ncbi:hypothetical protein M404DRAFT_1001281 [Pisolithus tinctorius Marx 270]|uniref:Uncharacterized protein n=1 Tax=Pisolithus tinctorius Marx 270 TaxID=870435 RepID=A0A0C3NR94_PISTI|nr:hypothetical protein M404DRAFT_1001281 [Pisolithus tinctorius Marx 270]
MDNRSPSGSTSDCFEVGDEVAQSFVASALGALETADVDRISMSHNVGCATTDALADAVPHSVLEPSRGQQHRWYIWVVFGAKVKRKHCCMKLYDLRRVGGQSQERFGGAQIAVQTTGGEGREDGEGS